MKQIISTCILILFIVLNSCSSKKNIILVQDIKDNPEYDYNYSQYIVKVDDILKIDVFTDHRNVNIEISDNISTSNTIYSYKFEGYQVDFQGYITYPEIGQLKVKGLTISEIKNLMKLKFIENEIINEPLIDIKLINSSFTVIGEVNQPGKYEFLENNLNIFEALGLAGDLTINGVRKDIKLIRENHNGETSVYNIDLTSSNILNSPFFQIFPGDIIIVSPNTSRIKNAGIIGNSGTLITLLSFILSSIIVINN